VECRDDPQRIGNALRKGNTPMKNTIAPRYVRPRTINGTRSTRSRHSQRRRSAAAWLRFFVEGLLEAHTTHAAYYRLVEKGVESREAIRAAFDLPASAAILPMIRTSAAARSDEERDQ
jgi:hypothetical protein